MLSSLHPSRRRRFFFFIFLSPLSNNPRCGLYLIWSLSSSFRRMSCNLHPQENPTHHYAKKCRRHFAPSKTEGKPYLTFFLSDEKESKQRKNRRHRFIGQFLLYTNGVNLNTLFIPRLFTIWLFHHHFLC